MRSMHSRERIEEMVCELESYRWDAIYFNTVFVVEFSCSHEYVFVMCLPDFSLVLSPRFTHMLNKKWRQRNRNTEHINERAITATIVVHRQRIKLMSVYFSHSGYADHHIEKMKKTIEKHTTNCKRYIPIVGGDFNAELGPGLGTECFSVGRCTLNEGNRRGGWMKHGLMLQEYTATQHDVQKNTSETNDFHMSKS